LGVFIFRGDGHAVWMHVAAYAGNGSARQCREKLVRFINALACLMESCVFINAFFGWIVVFSRIVVSVVYNFMVIMLGNIWRHFLIYFYDDGDVCMVS